MSNVTTEISAPEGHVDGITVEHILLSVTITSTKESAGQFDDSCASVIRRELARYHGVKTVDAQVQYHHTKIEKHPRSCWCHHCTQAKAAAVDELAVAIYDEMRGTDPEGMERPWVPGGNSQKQEDARREARARLSKA